MGWGSSGRAEWPLPALRSASKSTLRTPGKKVADKHQLPCLLPLPVHQGGESVRSWLSSLGLNCRTAVLAPPASPDYTAQLPLAPLRREGPEVGLLPKQGPLRGVPATPVSLVHTCSASELSLQTGRPQVGLCSKD